MGLGMMMLLLFAIAIVIGVAVVLVRKRKPVDSVALDFIEFMGIGVGGCCLLAVCVFLPVIHDGAEEKAEQFKEAKRTIIEARNSPSHENNGLTEVIVDWNTWLIGKQVSNEDWDLWVPDSILEIEPIKPPFNPEL